MTCSHEPDRGAPVGSRRASGARSALMGRHANDLFRVWKGRGRRRDLRGGCRKVHPLIGWRPDSRYVWGARALALAQWGRDGYVTRPPAALPPELTGAATAAPPALTSCSVCLDDFASDLPHPDFCSPCPRERWACPAPRLAHFVCLACDAHIQARANNRCPECRADRAVILSDV